MKWISKPFLAIVGLGLVASLITGCGDKEEAASSPRNAADQVSDQAAQYVEDPWVQRAIADEHQGAAREAVDSPCFMNPDHWDVYVKHGDLVCIAKR